MRRGLCCSQWAGESRGDSKAHSRRSAARRWYVSGASLACFWCQAGNRLAPRFPAPSQAARGVPPLATPPSRAASPPPDAQSAVRHAGGLPALALTTALLLATDCCGPPPRRPRWKAMLPAPSRHVQDPPPCSLDAPSPALRVKVRPELPENFPLRENFPASPVLYPLTRAGEGVRAWQAVRRHTGHGARTAPMPERHSHGRRTTRKVPK